MKEIPTVKVADPDCPGGFRIINLADMTDADKPFVEKDAPADKPAATTATAPAKAPAKPAAKK